MAKAPDPPSYKKLIKTIKKSRRVANRQRRLQMQRANEFIRDAKVLNADVIEDLDWVMDFNRKNAEHDRDRLETVFEPLEEAQAAAIGRFDQRVADFDQEVETLKADAIKFKSEANQQYMAGKAQAGVSQAFAQEKAATERALADAGVNFASGASRSLVAGLHLAEGAAQAAAGTQAADAARQEGDERYRYALGEQVKAGAMAEAGLGARAGLINVGRTYPGAIATEVGQVGTAGAQKIDQTVAISDAEDRKRALAADWQRIGQENLGLWTDALTKDFSNKLELYKAETMAEANESSGLGTALGAGAGILKSFLPGGGLFAADGGVVEPQHAQFFQDGGGVNDPNLSGTGGSTGNWRPTGVTAAASQPSAVDKVPAKLAVGEFVVPKHVVDWKGQQFFQNLIKQAPEQKQDMIAQTGATPRLGAIPV